MSLDALAADGRLQAQPLLSLLSCYAPATLIPGELLQPEPLAGLLTPTQAPGNLRTEKVRQLRDGLQSLATVGLIDIADSKVDVPGVTVHPVVADANRSRLLTAAHPGLPLIGRAAVQLLEAATADLDEQRPADWPAWRQLAP